METKREAGGGAAPFPWRGEHGGQHGDGGVCVNPRPWLPPSVIQKLHKEFREENGGDLRRKERKRGSGGGEEP